MFALIVGAAIATVTQRNIVHCAISLMLCFLGVAGYYALMQAEFLAGVQILIYVGAITVLMIFAVMLTQQLAGRQLRQTSRNAFPGLMAALVVLGLLVMAMKPFGQIPVAAHGPGELLNAARQSNALPASKTTTELIGQQFVTSYVWPFEIASLILLVALVGAIYIAREGRSEGERKS